MPRILDRRENETGPGGRGSDAGLKVAVFGASGMLGRYVCSHLGELCVGLVVKFWMCTTCHFSDCQLFHLYYFKLDKTIMHDSSASFLLYTMQLLS